MEMIDAVQLDFNPSSLFVLNIILALVMFGVALELRVDDFKRVLKTPKSAIIGLMAQLFILPAVTFLLTLTLPVPGSVKLGMILVAACPGGNVSNFMTSLAGGNSSLSISMTSVVTTAAIVTTPLNLAFWGGLSPDTAAVLQKVAIDPVQMIRIVALIIGLPVILGMWVRAAKPYIADTLLRPFKIGSLVFLAVFILVALIKNIVPTLQFILPLTGIVILHNMVALSVGYGVSWLGRLPPRDRRAITIEVGIQNSGLGLVLIFTFFGGLGGMATITSLWGIWHIISGLTIARTWSRIAIPQSGGATRG